jgi:D-serine deaminase-like pyridoxal phosphate-dependent protein
MPQLGPNAHLIGRPGSRVQLMTPALVIDLDALEGNIARMAEHARRHGVGLRPHAKTHKSVTMW